MKPLKGDQTHWPTRPICPVCRRRKVFEPHSFVMLSAWALPPDRRKHKARRVDLDDITVELYYHGAHDTGIGDRRDITVWSPIADRVHDAEVQFYFCSPKCVKTFLSRWVDAFEQKIQKAHHKHIEARPGKLRRH